jgi:hypothetical protein
MYEAMLPNARDEAVIGRHNSRFEIEWVERWEKRKPAHNAPV